MTEQQRAAMQQALERLRKYHHGNGFAEDAECIADLEAALAQQAEPEPEPEPEPVAWVRLDAWESGKEWPDDCFSALPADGLTPLYTAPPAAAACLRRQHAEIESLKAERDEDRRREYGYSQQTVDALKKECDALRAENEHLRKTAHEHVSRALYDAHTAELRAEADALRAVNERMLKATPPARRPLTDSEADALAHEMVKGGKSVQWLVRAIERAHGIGGNDE